MIELNKLSKQEKSELLSQLLNDKDTLEISEAEFQDRIRRVVQRLYDAVENYLKEVDKIRSEERKNMFERKNEFLSELTTKNNIFLKLYPNTKEYLNFGNVPLKSILSKNKTEFKLTIPSTPRYYITASIKELSRGSKHEIYFNSKEDMLKCYLILNSSYSYWWWRINDGCITLTKTVLENLPIKNIEINAGIKQKSEKSNYTKIERNLHVFK